MKYFVRVVSVLILLVYSAEGILFSAISGWGIVKGIYGLPRMGGGTIDGSPTPILDGFGKGLVIVGCVILGIVILMAAAEIFFLIRNYVKAIQNRSFRYYRIMSVIGVIAGVVNFVASILMTLIIITFPYVFNVESFLEPLIFVTFFVNVFMLFWCLLNLVSSIQCIRDGL